MALQTFHLQHKHSTDPERKRGPLTLLAQRQKPTRRESKRPLLSQLVHQRRDGSPDFSSPTQTLYTSREKKRAALSLIAQHKNQTRRESKRPLFFQPVQQTRRPCSTFQSPT